MSGLVLALVLAAAGYSRADAASDAPRSIFICTSSQLSPGLRQAIQAFTARAPEVPLLKALLDAKEADGVESKSSEDLMNPKAYLLAAHHHLVVIGLKSQDALLAKVWGYDASIDEKRQLAYSLGWGYLQGDIGWVESDWNPFLHSQRVVSAPEDTVLVKITGTTELGVEAALQAFEGGMMNGFVTAGSITRPQTTLLDLDPLPNPAPGQLPPEMSIGSGPAFLAGWTQIPEQEYRAVLESGGVEPVRMWRYKYLATGILEEKPIVRWLGGVNHMAYGNAVDIIQCRSPEDAATAAQQMAQMKDKGLAFQPVALAGVDHAWSCPQDVDETETVSTWNVLIASSGPYLFLSTLPPEGTSAVIQAVAGGHS